MKQTLEQRILALANDLRESRNDTVRGRLLETIEDDLRTLATDTRGAILVAQIEQGVRNALSDPFLFPKQVGQLTVADERMVELWTAKIMSRVTGTFPPSPKTGEEAAES